MRTFFSWASCSCRRSRARCAFTVMRWAALWNFSGSSAASLPVTASAKPMSVTAAMAQLVRPSALPSCSFVVGITRHRQLPVFAKPIARRTELAAASPATRMILAFLARAAEPTGSSPISTRPAL